MTSWQRVRSVFEAVCDMAAADREAVLRRECADEPELRAEIESLLDNSEGGPSFLDGPAVRPLQGGMLEDPQALVGRTIGAYRIVRVIASGGMGTVFLASRVDEQVARNVAIKVIRPGRLTDDNLRRFRDEQRALAQLDHPYIAHLIDGGVTEDGMPYLIMEAVEGQPVHAYCDEHRLPTAERLRLFRKICEAVDYAHRHLIVHRDIKPGNILVTEAGTPKLLDFGIAKVLEEAPTPGRAPRTRTTRRFMTVEYASPEQIRGQAVNTSSDVYSLGVLLYELLTGRRPHDTDSRTLFEAEQAICRTEPQKPSVAVCRPSTELSGNPLSRSPDDICKLRQTRPDRLRRRLSGDLDAIVMTSLRVEPQQRYGSVEQLSADIQRHLTGQPVRARAGTVRYLLVKFARRHAPAVTAAAIVLLVLVAGLLATMWQARVAAAERDRSDIEARKSQEVVRFLQDMLASADARHRGRDVTVMAVLEQASRRVEDQLGDPLVEATIRNVIGTTYHSLGIYDEAESHLRTALALREQNLDPNHPECLESLVELGSVLTSRGQYDEAETLLRESLEAWLAFDEAGTELATASSRLAKLLQLRGAYTEAEALRREELRLRQELLGDAHADVASSLMNLATVLHMQRRLDEAEPLYRKALAVIQDIHGDEDHSETADVLNNLASLQAARDELEEASALYQQTLDMRTALLGPEHPAVARTMSSLGNILRKRGDYASAEPLNRKALAIRRAQLGNDHPDVARSLYGLARTLGHLNKHHEAAEQLAEAVAIIDGRLRADHPHAVKMHTALGSALLALNRYQDAETALLAYHESLTAGAEPRQSALDAAADSLAELYDAWGRPREAQAWRSRGANEQGEQQ